MSEQSSTAGAELPEQLSAYLDGELDADARAKVEDLLARDPQARAELQRLERAWELLDGLPRAEMEPSFTRTTVEMIAVSLADAGSAAQPSTYRRPWIVWLGLPLACLGAALAGFGAVKVAAPDPNAALLRDLPVIENVELYLQGGNVAFLRALKTAGLFTEGTSNGAVAAPTTDRWAHVQRMSPAEKDQVLRKQQRFAQLDPAEQNRLRSFVAELDRAADAAQLRQVLEHYVQWLLSLQGLERALLLQVEPGQRIERIKQIQADESRSAGHRLSHSDLQAVSNWFEHRMMDNAPPQLRERLQKLPASERHREIVRMIWQRSQAPEGFKGPGPVKPGDLQELRTELSESARKQLNQAFDERRVGQLMTDWVRQVMGGYFGGRPTGAGGRGVSEERLKQFFENELPESERQQLLALPADELHDRVRRLYYLRMLGGDQPGAGGPGSRRPMRGAGPAGEQGRSPPPPPPPPRDRKPPP